VNITPGLERVWYARTEHGWHAIVGARAYRVKGWPELDLCIVRQQRRGSQLLAEWAITEGRTGRIVATGLSRLEAETRLQTVLANVGKEVMQARIARDSAGPGLSPRYTREEAAHD